MKRMWDEKELIAIAKQVLGYFGFKPLIVESLPETGEPNVLYLVPKEDSELGDIYEEFLWLNSAYESVGTTGVDLSDYVDLTSEQAISGVKKFSSGITIGNTSISEMYGNLMFKFLNISGVFLAPTSNNDRDLGRQGYHFRNLYLSGVLTDETNSVTVADLAALITYAKAQGWIS